MTELKRKTALILAALLLGAAVNAPAQETAEPPSPTAPGQPPGRLRAWVLPGLQGGGSITLAAAMPDGSPVSLADGARQSVSSSYRSLPPGRYSFELKDGENLLRQQQLQISPGSCHTLVAWSTGGKWNLEVYSDDQQRGAAQRPLRFFNFAGQATTTVGVGGLSKKVVLPPESVREVELPPKIAALDVSAQPPGGGAPARTLGEVDLTSAPAAYVLVAPDYRGRLRPQFIEAGQPVIAAQ